MLQQTEKKNSLCLFSIQNVTFCVWLLSLTVMFQGSSTLQYVSVLPSLLWLNKPPLYGYTVWMYHSSFLHSSVHRHLGGFYFFFSIMTNVSINISVPVFMWTYVFISLGYRLSSRTAGSHNDFIFNILRNKLFSKVAAPF